MNSHVQATLVVEVEVPADEAFLTIDKALPPEVASRGAKDSPRRLHLLRLEK